MATKTLLFVALSGIVFLSSCKKDSTSSTPKQNCKIDSIAFDFQPMKFFYNTDGKISSIIKGVGGGDTIYFTYGANTMVQTEVVLGDFMIKSSQLSSSGQVLKTNYSYYGYMFWEEDYEYDNNNVLSKVTLINNGVPGDIVTFIWENGNIISATLNGRETETFTYYTDKAWQDGDLINLKNLFNADPILEGIDFYHTSKNLVKSEVNATTGIDFNYTYGFDSEGKIISISVTNNSGGNSSTMHLQYKCN